MSSQIKRRNRAPTPNGTRFGRLVVISQAGTKRTSNRTERQYLCMCDCGESVVVCSGSLRGNLTKSCGCLHRELLRARQLTHGHSIGGVTSTEYGSWKTMRDRCNNPKNSHYGRYGARGIKVCKRWLNSFINFIADMGKKPSPKHSLHRVDNDKGYSHSNCVWATHEEQMSNKSNRRWMWFKGDRRLLVDVARITGMRYDMLMMRLWRGWTDDEALSVPYDKWLKNWRAKNIKNRSKQNLRAQEQARPVAVSQSLLPL